MIEQLLFFILSTVVITILIHRLTTKKKRPLTGFKPDRYISKKKKR